MKLHFIQRSMESGHFESQSAPCSPLSPPCRPLILKSLATPLLPSNFTSLVPLLFHSHCGCNFFLCGGTPLIQLSIEKHAKPRLCNCNFTPHIYVENFVHRNPLIRDKILFQAWFLDADQVYLLRYKHVNSATVFLFWHTGLFTRSDLDKNSCAYNLRTFEFKHFGITWIMTRLYSFKVMTNNKPHYE